VNVKDGCRSAALARKVGVDAARARFVHPLSGVKRVFPTQPGKAREVAVCRTEYQPMLDGKCGKVRILHQIRVNARRRKKFAKNFAMAFGGLRNPCPLGREPGERLPPRVRHRFGPFKHARIGGQAQEREKARPGKADRRYAVQAPVEPCACGLVPGKGADVGVDQQVGVDQYHRKDSPSAIASTSETLSMAPTRQRPSDTGRVCGARRLGGGAAICSRPCRSASFTSFFRLALRALRNRSNAMATSLSSVRVVLMHQSIVDLML